MNFCFFPIVEFLAAMEKSQKLFLVDKVICQYKDMISEMYSTIDSKFKNYV